MSKVGARVTMGGEIPTLIPAPCLLRLGTPLPVIAVESYMTMTLWPCMLGTRLVKPLDGEVLAARGTRFAFLDLTRPSN